MRFPISQNWLPPCSRISEVELESVLFTLADSYVTHLWRNIRGAAAFGCLQGQALGTAAEGASGALTSSSVAPSSFEFHGSPLPKQVVEAVKLETGRRRPAVPVGFSASRSWPSVASGACRQRTCVTERQLCG